MDGSTFSLSKSSNVEAGSRRLVEDPGVVLVIVDSGLFSYVFGLARRPMFGMVVSLGFCTATLSACHSRKTYPFDDS